MGVSFGRRGIREDACGIPSLEGPPCLRKQRTATLPCRRSARSEAGARPVRIDVNGHLVTVLGDGERFNVPALICFEVDARGHDGHEDGGHGYTPLFCSHVLQTRCRLWTR